MTQGARLKFRIGISCEHLPKEFEQFDFDKQRNPRNLVSCLHSRSGIEHLVISRILKRHEICDRSRNGRCES